MLGSKVMACGYPGARAGFTKATFRQEKSTLGVFRKGLVDRCKIYGFYNEIFWP